EADRVGSKTGKYRHINRAELQRSDDGNYHLGPARHQACDAVPRLRPQTSKQICKAIARFRQLPVSQTTFTAIWSDTNQCSALAFGMVINYGSPQRHLFAGLPTQRL